MIAPVVDYYAVLQVHERAEQEIIDCAYKKLAMMYHPDRSRAPDALDRMTAINQAYEVLGSPAARAQYDRQKPRSSAWAAGASGLRDDSALVITQYFACIRDGMYHDAYRLLSEHDRKSSGLDQFIAWRMSVGQYYRILRFRVGASRFFPDYEVCGGRVPARRFTIDIREENTQNGSVSEYAIIKYMVQESGSWRVHLGYSDLAAMARGLEERIDIRASTKPLTGMLGTATFIHRLEIECYRQKRYGQAFALGILPFETVRAPACGGEEFAPRLATLAGDTIARMLRLSDALGYFSPMRFAVLIDEAEQAPAKVLMGRLASALAHHAACEHDAVIKCVPELIETRGRTLGDIVDQCAGNDRARAWQKRYSMG